MRRDAKRRAGLGSPGAAQMSYESLAWDSDLFQIPIGRVRYATDCAQSVPDTVAAADDDGIECLYLLCPIDDLETLDASLDAGFRPYDVRVELARSLGAADPDALPVRQAVSADERALERIARERFAETRFFADPHFPRELCRELYARWLRRGLSTAPLRRTLTGGEREGFVVCRFDPEGHTGIIELFAASATADTTELGAVLVRAAEREFAAAGFKEAEVATQGRNLPAQRLYQRHGYVTQSMGVWLHRWRRSLSEP
jgi:ribosomal protein S18 acetylase RimI-like enzyme